MPLRPDPRLAVAVSIRRRKRMTRKLLALISVLAGTALTHEALAVPFFFTTGSPDNLMASVSRPADPGRTEIESADDFTIAATTTLTGATFTGLISGNATPLDVSVSIYRVFPNDSDTVR